MPTRRSISSGLAPGFWVMTSIKGGVGIGVSLDIQVQGRLDADPDQPEGAEKDDQPVMEAPGNDRTDHGSRFPGSIGGCRADPIDYAVGRGEIGKGTRRSAWWEPIAAEDAREQDGPDRQEPIGRAWGDWASESGYELPVAGAGSRDRSRASPWGRT